MKGVVAAAEVGCGGSERGSSQRESIALMTMLRAMCVCVCVSAKQTDKHGKKQGSMGTQR